MTTKQRKRKTRRGEKGARAERREAKRREAKRRSEATKRSRATAHEKEEISGEKKGKRLVKRIETKYKIFQKRPSEHTKGGAGDGWRAMSMVTAEDRKFW